MINTPPKQIKGLHSYHPQPCNKFPKSRILNSRIFSPEERVSSKSVSKRCHTPKHTVQRWAVKENETRTDESFSVLARLFFDAAPKQTGLEAISHPLPGIRSGRGFSNVSAN